MPRFHYRGGELDLTQHTHIMGILNITPDSFSDGGRYDTVEAAVERALAIQAEGADVLDIGAQSTRPGHIPVTVSESIHRIFTAAPTGMPPCLRASATLRYAS